MIIAVHITTSFIVAVAVVVVDDGTAVIPLIAAVAVKVFSITTIAGLL